MIDKRAVVGKKEKTLADLTPISADLPPRPTTRAELAAWTQRVLGIRIPGRSLCPGHDSPLDYLARSFFEEPGTSGDLLVWANRGGGKTMMAAVATLLEALYKAPIDIRLLGGSLDQSDRMAEYLHRFLGGRMPVLLHGNMTRRRIRLRTGADIRTLTQSQRAVRGLHVQRMRCDEVDQFDPEVWRALQFVTHSARGVRAAVEVFSTLHRAGGLMESLVDAATANRGYRLMRWCIWEVIERCTDTRPCMTCPLRLDCRGKAKHAEGFFPIEDAISIKLRSGRLSWEAEMLCRGARRTSLVFQEFDRVHHVAPVAYCPDWPLYRAIDFGYTNPFVCLWIQVAPTGTVYVLDEYSRTHRPISYHATEILRRDPGPAEMTYVDPAGKHRETTTGTACTELLETAGIHCAFRSSTIAEGLELIRDALYLGEEVGTSPGNSAAGDSPTQQGQPCSASEPTGAADLLGPDGLPLRWGHPALAPRLVIDPRCKELIAAFNAYHYPDPGSTGRSDQPVKDGPDHFIDALRYFFVNRKRPRPQVGKKTY